MGATFGCICVPETDVAVVERWGKMQAIAPPGLHMVMCCGVDQIAGKVSLRVQKLDIRCETKTKDNVFLTIVTSVQYEALEDRVYDAFYKLTDPHGQITAYVYDVVRASVPKIDLDDVFLTKDEIAHEIRDSLAKLMESYGYRIKQALIIDLRPDTKVVSAMNNINAQQRLRVASAYKAEAQKIAIVKAAEGDAESKYLAGVGISRQRLAIIDGLRDSVTSFTENVPGATTKDVMDLILVNQYFDCVKDIGAHCGETTLYLNHSPGAINDVAAQIHAGFMEIDDKMFQGGKKGPLGGGRPDLAQRRPFAAISEKGSGDDRKGKSHATGNDPVTASAPYLLDMQ